jgi:hypothetical protein
MIAFPRGYTAEWIERLESRYAAIIDAIDADLSLRRGKCYGGLLNSAIKHKLISNSSKGRYTVTAHGRAWREQYTGPAAEYATLQYRTVERVMRDQRAPKAAAPKPTPASVARAIVADGLLFIHPDMIEGPRSLNGEELKLWTLCMKYRRAPLTLAEVARRVGEPLEATAIRAERIRAHYALPLANAEDAERGAA